MGVGKTSRRGMSMKVLSTLWVALLVVFLLFGSKTDLLAQTQSTGALTGTVSDSSGAIIAGATVTITNNGTNQSQSATTNGDGSYKFSLLTPGQYAVRVEAPGFKAYVASIVTVNVTETPVLNASLEVGSTSEQVTITGEAPTLQTQTAAIGTLVDSENITSIPLTTRNFTQVLSLSSGVITGVTNAATLGKGNQDMFVNGNSITGNTYQIDGTVSNSWSSGLATDSTSNIAAGLAVPNPDAIAEFEVQTALYDASYGRNPGANVNLVTKTGSNDLHGSLFEFLRNDIFNANSFFRNAAGQSKAVMKQNQFGGAIGGPIKKDKIFFFGSYQGTRQRNGLDTSGLSTLNQPPLTNDRSAATIGAEFCPANHPGDSRYNTFAGGVQVACNGSNINPVALKWLQGKFPDGTYFIPTPQTIQANGLGFSSYSVPAQYREDQVVANGDYLITPKHTLSARFFYSRYPQLKPMDSTGANGSNVPGTPSSQVLYNLNPTLRLTSVFSSNFVNEFHVGGAYFNTNAVDLNTPTATSLGQTSATPFFNQPVVASITGSLGNYTGFDPGEDWKNFTQTEEAGDQISLIHGKQTFRFGGLVSDNYYHLIAIGRANGSSSFSNFTDFLLGQSAAQNGSPTGLSNVFSISSSLGAGEKGSLNIIAAAQYASLFLQDDIKVSPNLTLNLGTRWEYIPTPYSPIGNAGSVMFNLASLVPIPPSTGTNIGKTVSANYNPNTINPYTGQPFGLPTGVFVRPGNSLFSNGTPLSNFAPRIGLAWQPKGISSLVVRAGYGWFYETQGGSGIINTVNSDEPFNQRFSFSGSANAPSTLQQPIPTPTLGWLPRTPASVPQFHNGTANQINGVVQEYSLNVQHQLVSSMTLEVGYIGSRSTHNPVNVAFNQSVLATATTPVNCGLPTTAAGLGLSASAFATLGIDANGCITTNTAANARYRVPIIGETPNSETNIVYTGDTWFNSLQVTLRKRVSHGLTFQASYTYGDGLSDWQSSASGYPVGRVGNTLAAPKTYNWGPTDFDRRHRVVINYRYDFPTLIHEGFGSKVLGGWSLSGVTIAQGGTPLTITDSRDGTAYGNAETSTANLCAGSTYADLNTPGNDSARVNNWINTAAVCGPTSVPLGGVGPVGGTTPGTDYGNMRRAIMRGPGQFNWDISLGKETRVGGLREDARLQFRAEFYNAFNHPQFANPAVAANASASFGKITQSSVAPRLIQFGLKYLF